MKALVVDDVAYSRRIVEKALEQVGIEALLASSGADALRVFQQEGRIDVVITDLMMPDMDGIQFYERLKESQKANAGPLPPFILLTASPEPKLLVRAKQAGFLDIMVKPLDSNRLLQALKKHLGDELKEEFDYPGAIEVLESAVDEAVKTANREAASSLHRELQNCIEKLKGLLTITDADGQHTAKQDAEAPADKEDST